jgi:hypothetical protein
MSPHTISGWLLKYTFGELQYAASVNIIFKTEFLFTEFQGDKYFGVISGLESN